MIENISYTEIAIGISRLLRGPVKRAIGNSTLMVVLRVRERNFPAGNLSKAEDCLSWVRNKTAMADLTLPRNHL